jgi:general secretion pathway protein C
LLLTKYLPYDARSSLIASEASTRMDVAKRLAEWRDRPPEQWFTTVNQYAPPGVTAVLVIAIAYQLATLTWALVPGSTPAAVAPASRPSSTTTAPAADYSALTGSHLFGEAAEQPQVAAAPVVDAPDTTLSLTLTGILSKNEDGSGSVLIKNSRNVEKTYWVGQDIEGADGAKLHSVYADRVLLDRSGRLETLRFPKDLSASTGSPMAMPPLPQTQTQPAPLREVISQNASKLTDIIRPAPHVQEGQIVGFRVNPGRDRATFEALGFQPGDVVTDINGTVLDDVSQGLQIFESLGEATQANVTVLRDGVPQVLVIDTTQLQKLQENRQ